MPQNFCGQNLRGRNFKGQDLTGADFSHAHIQSANFTNLVRSLHPVECISLIILDGWQQIFYQSDRKSNIAPNYIVLALTTPASCSTYSNFLGCMKLKLIFS